jgi:predicted short-subunit dehydrogenase-like oxidoreductase (DUF2520 family)
MSPVTGIMKPSFVIIGGGKVGTSLGRQLARAGYRPLGVTCQTPASAARAAEMIGAEMASTIPWEITPAADIVFISTPDGVIASVCDAIREHDGFSAGSMVLHCSGALPSTILNIDTESDVAVGSIHPLQSFAAVDPKVNPFQGIIAAIEGDEKAVRQAREVGEALGATCFLIKTEAKTLYHASAVVASNYLVALVDISLRLLESAGIKRGDGFQVLSPLINGTLTNIGTIGIPDALTGPIARGDTETVATHVQAIYEDAPEIGALYSQLGLLTIGIARDKGTLSAADADAFKQFLSTTLAK